MAKNIENNLNIESSWQKYVLKTFIPIIGDVYYWKSGKGEVLKERIKSQTIVMCGKYTIFGLIAYELFK